MYVNKNFWKILITLAMPLALQSVLESTASILDTIMIGSEGELAVASIGICSNWTTLYNKCFFSILGVTSMFLAQYWGCQDQNGMNISFGMGLTMLICITLIFSSAAFLCPQMILRIFTDKENIIELGVKYIRIVGFAYPIQGITRLLACWMKSTERVKEIFVSSVVGMITNFVLNWILIYGRFGFPKMGITGAAIGTLVSAFITFVLLLILMHYSECAIQLKLREMILWKKDFVKTYVKKSIPITANEVLVGLGGALVGIVIGRQAESAIAAYVAAETVGGFSFAFLSGFADAGVVLIGKKIGAGRHKEGYNYMKVLSVSCALLTGGCCLIIAILHKPFLELFHLGEEAMYYGKYILMIYVIIASLIAFNCFLNTAFRSGGDAVYGSVVRITMFFLVSVSTTWITGIWLKTPFLVVYICAYLYEVACFILEARHAWSAKWIKPVTESGKAALDEFFRNQNNTGGY